MQWWQFCKGGLCSVRLMKENFKQIIENFLSSNHSDKMIEKGREYIGEFINRLSTHDQVMGVTKGRYGTYNTLLGVDESGVYVDCDCPSSKLSCHHAIGLALTYINFPDSFQAIHGVAANLAELDKESIIEVMYRIAVKKPRSFILIEAAMSGKEE